MAAFWSGDSGGRADGLRAEDEAESSFVAPLRIVRVLRVISFADVPTERFYHDSSEAVGRSKTRVS